MGGRPAGSESGTGREKGFQTRGQQKMFWEK